MQGNPFKVRSGNIVARTTSAAKPNLEEIADRTQGLLDPGRFSPQNEEQLERLAYRYYRSGRLPDHYYPKKWEDRWKDWAVERGVAMAYIAMMEGDAIGVGPVMAIKQIHIINGVSTMSADLMFGRMLATRVLARDDYTLKASKKRCEIVIGVKTRLNPEDRLVVVAEYDDFKHLHKKDNWMNDPEGMCVARCKTRAAKRHAPDLFVGVYSREEMMDLVDDMKAGVAVEVPAEMLVGGNRENNPEPLPHADGVNSEVGESLPKLSKPEYDEIIGSIKGMSETATVEAVEALRARVLRWREDVNYKHFVRAWEANVLLGPLDPAEATDAPA